jgi:Arylsulfotransferase (ASST)
LRTVKIWRAYVPLGLLVLLAGGLTACNSDSSELPLASSGVITDSAPTASAAASLGIQFSPPLSPSFDPDIHDYVVDCSTSQTAQLSIAGPRPIGFQFLGTSGTVGPVQPENQVQFRQTVTLNPGQGYRFAIGGRGTYSVRCLPPDFPPLEVTLNGTPRARWYVFTPDIGNAAAPYVIITDSRGTPVWWYREAVSLGSDAKLLGSNQIAWTSLDSSGAGTYVIRTFTGQTLNVLTGNLDGHDLQPTPAGTFLAIQYVPRVCPPDCADMSPWGGSAQQAVIDAVIMEIDPKSNVLWSWRTRDHIALSETGAAGWFPAVGNDIIHMNAIAPDGTDGLIFSARHLNAIYHITKSTGAIDWKVGGVQRLESFSVIGDVRPTTQGASGFPLFGQHDVRLWSDGTVSVHDNGSGVRPPAIIRFQIDTVNRTAQVVESIQDARAPTSACCGSARRLPGGNWLVAWGESPFMTELDPTGQPVLTIQYNLGTVFSYRAVPVLPGIVSADVLRDGMDAMAHN